MIGNAQRTLIALFAGVLMSPVQAQDAPPQLGAMPDAAQFPQVEFVFEERVTLAPAAGETPVLGARIKVYQIK